MRLLLFVLGAAVLAVPVSPERAWSQPTDPDKEKRAKAIEKQIADLRKQIADLETELAKLKLAFCKVESSWSRMGTGVH